MRGLNACGLLVPPPYPYLRLSFTDLAKDLRNMSIPDYCSETNHGNQWDFDGYRSKSDCNIKAKISACLEDLETELNTGLRLEQFGRG